MIVQSQGILKSLGFQPAPSYATDYRSSAWNTLSASGYAAIYRTQPNVRTVVDFLARNIAQLGIHAYRRVSDLDRERLADHDLIAWLDAPNPGKSRYRLIETLMLDLGIYFNAYWLKVRNTDRVYFFRMPPERVVVTGGLMPESFVWTLPDGRQLALKPNDVVYWNGYDPCDPLMGLSPLETLRQLLAEDAASSAFREAYWTNSARLEGVITRPLNAPRWTPNQKQDFREQWTTRFAGSMNAGQTAVLEDGMTFTPTSYSARDSEFTAARKLTREEVAAAYHVPQPMVGILDHATFSNIKEQHKQLYQDTLGPWLEWIQEELERQILAVECSDTDGVYLEFNIADKLKGSFEEQAAALYQLIGRPIMTANEGRARLNLPSIQDDPTANELALPLNTSGGPSVTQEPDVTPATDTTRPQQSASLTTVEAARVTPILRAFQIRVRDRLQKAPADKRAQAFFVDFDRWTTELATDLTPLLGADRARDVALDRAVALAVELENV